MTDLDDNVQAYESFYNDNFMSYVTNNNDDDESSPLHIII